MSENKFKALTIAIAVATIGLASCSYFQAGEKIVTNEIGDLAETYCELEPEIRAQVRERANSEFDGEIRIECPGDAEA